MAFCLFYFQTLLYRVVWAGILQVFRAFKVLVLYFYCKRACGRLTAFLEKLHERLNWEGEIQELLWHLEVFISKQTFLKCHFYFAAGKSFQPGKGLQSHSWKGTNTFFWRSEGGNRYILTEREGLPLTESSGSPTAVSVYRETFLLCPPGPQREGAEGSIVSYLKETEASARC